MSLVLKTNAGPGGVGYTSPSDLEARAFGIPGMVMHFDAGNTVPTARSLEFYNGADGTSFVSLGAVTLNTTGTPAIPALQCNGTAEAMVVNESLILPASYTLYALVYPNTDENWLTIAAHKTRGTGSMWLFSDALRRVHLAHGAIGAFELESTSAYTTSAPYVVAVAYDAGSATASIGVNTTTLDTGTIVPHNGSTGFAIGGTLDAGVGFLPMNGWLNKLILFKGSHGIVGRENDLAEVMAYLAGLAGITLI